MNEVQIYWMEWNRIQLELWNWKLKLLKLLVDNCWSLLESFLTLEWNNSNFVQFNWKDITCLNNAYNMNIFCGKLNRKMFGIPSRFEL